MLSAFPSAPQPKQWNTFRSRLIFKDGFFETEIHRDVQQFGSMAHVWSTYESRQKADGPVIDRGINSIQLYFDGTRWWIAAVMWQDE